MKDNSRFISFDIISGILILWMIVYHSFQWAELEGSMIFHRLLNLFYFFMAWFYFKAGFLFNNEKPIKENLVSGVTRLIIPMFFWFIIGYLLFIPYLVVIEGAPIWKLFIWPAYSIISSGDTIGNSPLWFLLSLFIVRILLFFISRLSFFSILNIFLLSVLVGWLGSYYSLQLPLGLISTPIGLAFSLSGFLVGRKIKIESKSKLSIVSVLLVTLLSFFYGSYVDIHTNSLWFGDYFLYILSSIVLITFLIPSLFFEVRSISWIGENSMIFLVSHWPIFTLIKYIWIYFKLETGYVYAFILAFSSIVIGIYLRLKFSDKKLFLDGREVYSLTLKYWYRVSN
ncbi:acyltransferase [Pseudoalteromonas sp. CAL260-MNA-CIBAN-0059]|uniref:acyltransferase n=1 Tax=Pseudoalteromonas sp. CAL260-MNA-CIBAN-0059 TaxID=3140430 RepID=UPI00331A1DC7